MKIHVYDIASNGAVFRFSVDDEEAAMAAIPEHFELGIPTVTRGYIEVTGIEKVPGTLNAAIAAVGATPLPKKFTR